MPSYRFTFTAELPNEAEAEGIRKLVENGLAPLMAKHGKFGEVKVAKAKK